MNSVGRPVVSDLGVKYSEFPAEYFNKWKKQKKAFCDWIKEGIGCTDCGYKSHLEALDFDHIRGPKLMEIGHCKKVSWAKLLNELPKCEVVCANCHRVRTAERRGK